MSKRSPNHLNAHEAAFIHLLEIHPYLLFHSASSPSKGSKLETPIVNYLESKKKNGQELSEY
uniref:Uncharacterized protein n=1 Tax=Oryza meridionalis TaxID=40149 RepID=A0A0E0D8J9_9ORYZ